MRRDTARIKIERCNEPLGADYYGIIVCILLKDHGGPHDGGKAERDLGERLTAQILMDEWEHSE